MHIVGIDEVGRGCWAGPLVAGAVVLDLPIVGLKDSKLLSKLQRERLAQQIHVEALAIGIGWVSPQEIDTHGLTTAVSLAMRRALAGISIDYQHVVIDGNYNFLPDINGVQTVVKADTTVPAVSAASIIAKVARDAYMADMAIDHPEYGFEKHVGYGTALHLQRLKQYGVSTLHRRSFKPVQGVL